MELTERRSVLPRLGYGRRAGMASVLLCLAVMVYGLWGVPTPLQMGVPEITIGALLALSALGFGAWNVFDFKNEQRLWTALARAFLIFGLTVPLLMSVGSGNDMAATMRDMAAFVFMMIPLIFIKAASHFRMMLFAVIGLGILLAVRCLHLDMFAFMGSAEKLDYLENMPSVLFAALFLAGSAVGIFCERFSMKALSISILCGLSACNCLMPLIATAQRASLGVFALGLMMIVCVQLWQRPKRAFWLLPVLGILLLFFLPQISEILSTLTSKNILVGNNMRGEELAAVWNQISVSPFTVLFGHGWGAQYASPAVAGISINYTHSLLSALLLKAGLSGVILGGAYIAGILFSLVRQGRTHLVLVLALAGPLLIDVFLYASYKSLDFGLVLALAAWLGMNNDEKQAEVIASSAAPF
jgi:hypothetical protein